MKACQGNLFRTALLSVACITLLAAAPAAQASTMTLGSSLPSTLTSLSFLGITTETQQTLPGATLTSPFDGTIVSWQVSGASGGPLKLQVVHPLGNGLFTGAGTAYGQITGPGILTFQASLPIKTGDAIAIVPTTNADKIGQATTPGATYELWGGSGGPLSDGGAGRAPTATGFAGELGFNATVQSLPTGERAAALKKCKHKHPKKKRKKCRKRANKLPV